MLREATPERAEQEVALVLCGGGSKGAVEVGFLRAMAELGVSIHDIIGVSIGALNGAFIAAGMPLADLEDLWRSVKFSDLFAFNWGLLRNPRAAASLYSNHKLRRLLEEHLPPRFEDLLIPLTIVGTDLRTSETVLLEEGNLIDAILGSMAIPGLLPPVRINGRDIVDGGLTNNLPLDVAAEKRTRLIMAMRCGCRRPLARSPRGILGMLSRSFDISFSRRGDWRNKFHDGGARLVVFEPCLDENISLLDFNHTAELIEIGYQCALSEARSLTEDLEAVIQ